MSMRHILVAAAALAALGAGAALLLSGGDSEGDLEIRGSRPEERHQDASPTSSGGGGETVGLATLAYSGGEDEDWDEPASADEALRYALIVGPDGRPVAGAEVALHRAERRERGRRFDRGAAAAATPIRTVKSGPDGFALLTPVPRRGLRIEARTDHAFGVAEYPREGSAAPAELPAGADVVVELQPIKSIQVKVVDPSGNAVPHVRVVATAKSEGGENPSRNTWPRGFRPGGDDDDATVSGWTEAPDGVAVLEVTTVQRELYAAEDTEVAAALPGLERVVGATPLNPEGTTHIVLEVPPTVTVRLHPRLQDGTLVKEPLNVTWWVELPEEGGNGARRDFARVASRSVAGRRQASGGLLTLAGFAPGCTVRFTTHARDRLTETTTVPIPPNAWEVDADLLVGAKPPRLEVRVADSAGAPIANTEFDVRLVLDDPQADRNDRPFGGRGGRGGPDPGGRYTTDRDGRLRAQAVPGVQGILELRPRDARRGPRAGDDEPPLGSSPFPKLLAGETKVIGDIILGAEVVLLAGKVVDRAGEPVAGARVSVRSDPRDPQQPGPGRQRGRERGSGTSAETGSDGAFRVYGHALPGVPYELEAESRGFASLTMPVAPGSKDVVVTLTRAGGVEGRVRLADPALDLRPEVRVRATGREEDERGRRGDARVQDDGKFVVRNLMPGTYELEVLLGGQSAHVVGGIEVPEGEIVAPPALQDLIVGRDWFRAVVIVHDRAGQPVPRAEVSFSASGSNERRFRQRLNVRTDERGEASRWLRRDAEMRVTVRADKLVPVTLSNPPFPLSVTLEPAPSVVLHFPTPLPAHPGVTSYRVFLSPATGPDGSDRGFLGGWIMGRNDSVEVTPGGQSARIDDLAPGSYRVRLWANNQAGYRRGGQGRRGGGFPMAELGELTVPPGVPVYEAKLALEPATFLERIAQAAAPPSPR